MELVSFVRQSADLIIQDSLRDDVHSLVSVSRVIGCNLLIAHLMEELSLKLIHVSSSLLKVLGRLLLHSSLHDSKIVGSPIQTGNHGLIMLGLQEVSILFLGTAACQLLCGGEGAGAILTGHLTGKWHI